MKEYVLEKSQLLKEQLGHFDEMIDVQMSFERVMDAVRSEEYTAVILGEFNAGKTSFINAFLGEEYLPVGMTPTTSVIYEVRYGERPFVEIRKADDTTVRVPEGMESLEAYLQASGLQPSDVQSIYIEQPLALLANHITLVDTPGLNDLEHARPEVTYRYLPKADVVFFVINSNMPLRKTEMDFIQEELLEQGIEQMIIVLTRIDQLDDDELDEVVHGVHTRLKHLTEQYEIEIPIVPISNIEALEAQQTKDDELYEFSGMLEVQETMKEYFGTSRQQAVKSKRLEYMYNDLLRTIESAMNEQLDINRLNLEELHSQLVEVERMKIKKTSYFEEYAAYVQERQLEIYQMLERSLTHFYEKLEKEIQEELYEYSGPDFVEYAGKRVPRHVERAVKTWVDQYVEYIRLFIQKIGEELYASSTDLFEELRTGRYQVTTPREELEVVRVQRAQETKRFFDDGTAAATVYGGAGVLLVSLGAPVILPALALVGLPKLREFFSERNKEKHMPDVLQWTSHILNQNEIQMEDVLKQYIQTELIELVAGFKRDFEEGLEQYEQLMKTQLVAIEGDQAALEERNRSQTAAYDTVIRLQSEAMEKRVERVASYDAKGGEKHESI